LRSKKEEDQETGIWAGVKEVPAKNPWKEHHPRACMYYIVSKGFKPSEKGKT